MSERPPLAAPRGNSKANNLNPYSAGEVSLNARPIGGLVAVEQQRAVAEVQARMLIARANPRDPIAATEKILNACTRSTLAERAVYQYARGGTDIRGPTIRLAEAIAQQWGNIASGIKEISRHGEYSECVAYAWDLESGYYDERQFQVRHWRDTRSGGYQLTDERDIYELIANFGQRRKRAVLLTVIPGDVIEAALEQCEITLHSRADVTPEGIKKLIDAFAEVGVTQQQIEARIQRRLEAIRPAQVVSLRNIYNSLRDGMSVIEDWFGEQAPLETGRAAPDVSPPPAAAGSAGPSQAARRGRPPGPRRQQEEPPPQPSDNERAFQERLEQTWRDGAESEQETAGQQPEPPPAQRRQVDFDV